MKHAVLIALLLAGSLLARPAVAQSAPAGMALPAITPSHHQAALAMLSTIYTETTYNQMIAQKLAAQLAGQPMLKPYQEVYQAFYQKYAGWSATQEIMADIYARDFTERELKQLQQFYATSVGRKYVLRLPSLMQQAIDLGQRTVQEHKPELEKALADKAAALTNSTGDSND